MSNPISSETGAWQTLAQRLAQRRMPVTEALRYAAALAESLRNLHDAGRVHGALTPSVIWVSDSGLELLMGQAGAGVLTPYTAPELLEGKAADARSDIFAYGAVLYEMLTGHRAFAAETPIALATAIAHAQLQPSGSLLADQLIGSCLAKDPDARWQQFQNIVRELEPHRAALASFRHAPVESVPSPVTQPFEHQAPAPAAPPAASPYEIGIAEFAGADLRRPVGDAGLARIERSLAALHERVDLVERSIESVNERIARAERDIEGVRQQTTVLHTSVAEDFVAFEQSLKTQAGAIESARTSMAQTDDLVERLVEALESIQTVVLEHSQERDAHVN